MLKINFVTPTDNHLRELQDNAPQEQIDEVYASHGTDIYTAARAGVQRAEEAWAALSNGKLLGITAITPYSYLSSVAFPWLLTTGREPKLLLKGTKIIVNRWSSMYDTLIGFIDARYTASLRWAKWAGFTILPAEPFGYLGLPFHRIEIRKTDGC